MAGEGLKGEKLGQGEWREPRGEGKGLSRGRLGAEGIGTECVKRLNQQWQKQSFVSRTVTNRHTDPFSCLKQIPLSLDGIQQKLNIYFVI